mgnify:CR=1 FL=1
MIIKHEDILKQKSRKVTETLSPKGVKRMVCLAIVLCICSMLNVQATVQQQRITVSLKNVTIEAAMSKVEALLHQSFFVNRESVNMNRTVNLELNNATLEVLVEKLFGKGFKYELVNNIIVISKRKEESSALQQAQQPKQAQETVVTGVVLEESGGMVPGASVMLKGTTIGVATDINGNFSLKVPASHKGKKIIVSVSFVGMKKVEREYTGKPLTFKLEEDMAVIGDVVVNGYFQQAKNSFTGAARTILQEDLQKASNQNILTALQNIDPSFMKVENNLMGSNPNVIPDFQIRGSSSISTMESSYTGNPNMPVFIVDGFEASAEKVFDMDPYRVASITLLKDAAATAIYGSRASNGVVVITTNVPAKGKIQLSYNADATIYMADLSDYDLCNATEKLEIERLAGMYTARAVADQINLDESYNTKLSNIQKGYNTYWLDKPIDKSAIAQKHSLRLDGGTDNIRYAMEVNYSDTPGVMKGSGRKRMGVGMDLQYIYKNITFKNSLTYSDVSAVDSPYGSYSTYGTLNPYVRYKNDEGHYIYKVDEFAPVGYATTYPSYNPLFNTTLHTKSENGYSDLTNNFGIDWTVMEGLRLKGSFAIIRQNTDSDTFKPAKHTDFANYSIEDFDRRGSYVASRGESTIYNANLILTYFWQMNKHVLNSNLGWNIQENVNKSFSVQAEGFPNEKLDYISFATQYQKNGSPSGSEYTSRLVGFLGNVNYSYDEKYLLDLSFRGDASSRFGSDNRWAPFWSVGLGWNIHNEKFLKKVEWIDRLKIRASYGLTGSQDYNPYQAITTYQYLSGSRYHNSVGASVIAMGNEDLGWQRTTQQNYGLDLDFWKNRITLTANFYVKDSKDVLTAVTLPPSLGFGSYMDNLGEVQNVGYEVDLRVAILENKRDRLFWSVNGTVLHNTNKLKKISNALKAYNEKQDNESSAGSNRPKVRYIEGQSMNSIWVNESLGIDPATGNELFRAKNGDVVSDWSPDNYVIGGSVDPKAEGTFGTNFSWKGFQLNMIFRYSCGGYIYNQTLVDKVQDADLRYNVDRRVFLDRWQKPGDEVMFAKFGDGFGANVGHSTKPTSRFIEKNNYLDLATLNIAYDFSMPWMKHIGLKRLKATFYMNDVFHISTVKQERGISYPYARNFSVGLQARF